MIRHQFVNYSVNFKTNLNIFLRNKYNKQPEKISVTVSPLFILLFCAFYECKFLMLIQCDCDMRMNDVKQKLLLLNYERENENYILNIFFQKRDENKYKNIIKRKKSLRGIY